MSDVVVGALIGVASSVIGYIINNLVAYKIKQVDVLFPRKEAAYSKLLADARDFGLDPKDTAKFMKFQTSIFSAVLVASPEVRQTLDKQGADQLWTLHNSAILLRNAGEQDIGKIQVNEWYKAMEGAIRAMQADISGLGTPSVTKCLHALIGRKREEGGN